VIKSTIKRLTRAAGYNLTRFPHGCEQIEAHLALLLPHLDINCVLDVGANCGQYARLLRSVGYRGRIVSFEPVADAYSRLAKQADSDPNWVAYDFALGESDRAQDINVTASTDFSSFLPPNDYGRSTFGNGPTVASVQRVPMRRLDAVFEDCMGNLDDPRVFLKMDTQGYDPMIIEGAAGCMERILGVQSELSVRPIYNGAAGYRESLAGLEEMGYQLTGLFPRNRDRGLRLIELEVVMIKSI
jgi:FkbM family methyltransferase